MAMAPKLFVCLTLLYILPSIPTSSSDFTDSIASAPSSSSSSLQSNHGLNLDYIRSFSSFLRQKRSHGSRKLTNGNHRGRLAAETGNNTAPGPAAAPGPASSSGNLGTESKKKKLPSALKWLAGISLGAITGAISALIASFLFRAIRDYVTKPKPGKPVVFQRKVINAKALDFLGKEGGTESLELLGKGGSGEVYKAILENGTAVAIKRIIGMATPLKGGGVDHLLENSYDLTKNSAQIQAELNTLGQIRHRNLVKLLAYIPQPAAHLLIYDFMENGSLHDVMFKVAENMLELPWPKRLDIAKDVATGLKYLHLDCNPKIIHCDLKPGNILLDEAMVAHIGDFGLAKVIPDKRESITGNNVAGTVGYIAPEYYQSLKYTTRGDVYGFGVVLVVLLTGKEPTHSYFSDVYSHMGDWLANVMASGAESAIGVLDTHLRGHGDEGEMLLALKVAVFCLHGDPRERPSAEDVLKMLNQIRDARQRTHKDMELLLGGPDL